MQEYAWLHGIDFRDMIGVIRKEANARKLGLAACAYVRSRLDALSDRRLREAVETAEDYADFRATKQQVKAAKHSLTVLLAEAQARHWQDKDAVPERAWADPEHDGWWQPDAIWQLEQQARLIELILKPSRVDADILLTVAYPFTSSPGFENQNQRCELLREIFGNPFRPVNFSSEWRTDTTVSLASQMYESREFSAMPILADALQDAGCDSEDILSHCRDANQAHVRGCWVVDLVLGKE
jgi:hypothetical protein